MKLELTAFVNAVARLQEGIDGYEQDKTQTLIRDGLVQRFEFTYEISYKMLKRYLEQAAPNPKEYDNMPFPDLIRSGNEQGLLLGDWPKWKTYRDMRAKTSHTYNEKVALEVVAEIPAFLQEARYLCDRLKQRQS